MWKQITSFDSFEDIKKQIEGRRTRQVSLYSDKMRYITFTDDFYNMHVVREWKESFFEIFPPRKVTKVRYDIEVLEEVEE